MAKWKLVVVLVICILLSNGSFGMYDDKTGRFMQRDPLGVNPAGGKQNRFSPTRQYTDGINGYEYVRSNSMIFNDPLGHYAFPGGSYPGGSQAPLPGPANSTPASSKDYDTAKERGKKQVVSLIVKACGNVIEPPPKQPRRISMR